MRRNKEKPHQDKNKNGRTPCRDFVDGIKIDYGDLY